MNGLKKILGVVWILLAPSAVIFMFMQAIEKTHAAKEGIARTNTALQWGIILFIFIPICTGLAIFGYYALQDEYRKLPKSSKDL
ncbi:hypothetical protein CNR22_00445 [Sphingobacteriaceae bacterium]|nr:hypothetical protein CNR22_00445 [Sphingobacteriaceae bacterium]